MPKTQLGTKRVCPSCGARFYDLTRRPIECPKCGFSFEPDQIVRARKSRAEPREPKVAAAVDETEDDLPEDEAEDDLIEADDDAEVEPLEEEAVAEEPKKPARRAKRAPSLEEEEDVGVLPDDDDDDLDVDVDVGEDDVLVEDDELANDDLSDIIEDDGKDEPV